MKSLPPPPRDRGDFEIAIICALPLEANAVINSFDKDWEDEGRVFGKANADPNAYTVGVIGKHNVVVAHMPNMGTVPAAIVATNLRSSFQNIKLAMIVGICGAVPYIHDPTGSKDNIFLGDVVVSQFLIQYDFGKQQPDGFVRKDTLKDCEGRPPFNILSLLSKFQTEYHINRLSDATNICLAELLTKVKRSSYPGLEEDKLDTVFDSSFIHKHYNSATCVVCREGNTTSSCSNAREMTCSEIGCHKHGVISRTRQLPHHDSSETARKGPRTSVHIGTMGSGNSVMRSGKHRDDIAQKAGIVAFEMESAGVWKCYPSVVVKGVADYADSHKDKVWQRYATAAAAACNKSFLQSWDAIHEPPTQVQEAPVWYVPFEDLPDFIGRTSAVQRIETLLYRPKGPRRAAITGLGGAGKSRAALEIAHRTRIARPECSVFWIQATDMSTFEKSYLEIGRMLRIPGLEDKGADSRSLVKQWLSLASAGEWLLILDGADNGKLWCKALNPRSASAILTQYLPSSSTGHILVTTRNGQVAQSLAIANVVKMEQMESTEAREMMQNLLVEPSILECDETDSLLERLAFLPLAIVQAAAFINNNTLTLAQYLRLLDNTEEKVIEFLSEDFEDHGRYETIKNPISSTWIVSFEQIQTQNKLAAEYLSYMACLNHKSIPESLLPSADNALEATKALGLLMSFSFLTRLNDSSSDTLYDMHHLVHLATRNWLRMQNSLNAWTMKATERLSDIFPNRDYKKKYIWTLYMSHADTLTKIDIAKDQPYRYILMEKVGYCHFFDGKYDKAVRQHALVASWRAFYLGKTNTGTLHAYNNLGEALREMGDWVDAERYCKLAVEGLRKKLGPDARDTLISIGNLASTFRRQGRLPEAEELQTRVMETSVRVLGEDHPDTLRSMANLASTYSDQGRWREAEKLRVTVVDTSMRVLGQDHPDTLTSMANLASTYSDQGRWREAEELDMRVMETRVRVLGRDHPNTLSSMANLASTYSRQGRYTEAVELDTKVMETSVRVLGRNHPDTLNCMANLASTLRDQGNKREALKLLSESVFLSLRKLGENHPSTTRRKARLLRWEVNMKSNG